MTIRHQLATLDLDRDVTRFVKHSMVCGQRFKGFGAFCASSKRPRSVHLATMVPSSKNFTSAAVTGAPSGPGRRPLPRPAFVRPRSYSCCHRRRGRLGTEGLRRAPWSPRHVALGEPGGRFGQPHKEKEQKRETTMLTTFALVFALALPCWAQVRELPTQTTTIAGSIETIDQSKRAMNIKTADGKFVAVNVPRASRASTSSRWGTR